MKDNGHNQPLDAAAIRAHLEGATGPRYWRSLEELAETEAFRQFLEDEFPQQARPLQMAVDRRQFLTLMGASLALAGLSGCRYLPQDKVVPYVKQPEDLVLGQPLYFATAATLGGYGIGLLAETHEGRPTKLEGNPNHPASLGATDAITQALLLTLYDPDRSTTVLKQGQVSTWEGDLGFLAAMRAALDKQRPRQGAGLRIVTETISSPTLAAKIEQLLQRFPQAQWIQHDPLYRHNALQGTELAFGEKLNAVYQLKNADVILALDGDFLVSLPGSVRYAREFMDRRRVRKETTTMNRLYAVESAPTLTGAIADHRLALKASEIEAFARALAAELGINVNRGETPQTIPAKWITALANDLKAHSGRCVVIPGDHQSPTVHALAHAINAKLNSVGSAVLYTEPVEAAPGDQTAALKRLTDDINAGKVEFLAILGSNPAYTAPADVAFAEALRAGKVPFSFHSGLYFDETAQLCGWHVPGTHFAEEWGDVRAYDGTVSLVQPLITPLYNGVSALEILVAMLSDLGGGYEQVRDHWRAQKPGPNFEQSWEKWLNTGVVPNTAFAPKTVTVKSDLTNLPIASPGKGLELNFRLDPTVLDGRFANNGWLQELPKPLLRTTWDNVVAMSPATAVKLNLASAERPLDAQEKQVKLTFKGREVTGLVWLLPGHPEDSLTVHLGYGRAQAGKVGTDRGFNANLIRPSDALWFGDGLEIAPTGSRGQIATTQYHHQMENRDLIRVADIGGFVEKKGKIGPAGHAPAHEGAEHGAEHASGDHAAEGEHHDEAGHAESGNKKGFKSTMHQEQFLAAEQRHPSLYPGTDFAYDGYKWGMSVDLNTCIGCNACVSACTAENNVPVVGKSQVTRGRAMHWIRIDTYYEGAQPNLPSGTYFQPILCMHCEQAPCEPVCPVAATVHSHEGLNQMVYNRCVGTKYCSNNCPYKVRRFNFYKYTAGRPDFEAGHGYDPPVMHLLTNPNVTLRGRGVMEKCTFCVQRINAARIEAKKQNRKIRDGEIKTACQQACPTQAIVFGDLSDPESRVSRLKTEPHDYTLLDDLNTRPRLTFLAKLRNPNPELA